MPANVRFRKEVLQPVHYAYRSPITPRFVDPRRPNSYAHSRREFQRDRDENTERTDLRGRHGLRYLLADPRAAGEHYTYEFRRSLLLQAGSQLVDHQDQRLA